jgi:hypothetical protein
MHTKNLKQEKNKKKKHIKMYYQRHYIGTCGKLQGQH